MFWNHPSYRVCGQELFITAIIVFLGAFFDILVFVFLVPITVIVLTWIWHDDTIQKRNLSLLAKSTV